MHNLHIRHQNEQFFLQFHLDLIKKLLPCTHFPTKCLDLKLKNSSVPAVSLHRLCNRTNFALSIYKKDFQKKFCCKDGIKDFPSRPSSKNFNINTKYLSENIEIFKCKSRSIVGCYVSGHVNRPNLLVIPPSATQTCITGLFRRKQFLSNHFSIKYILLESLQLKQAATLAYR